LEGRTSLPIPKQRHRKEWEPIDFEFSGELQAQKIRLGKPENLQKAKLTLATNETVKR